MRFRRRGYALSLPQYFGRGDKILIADISPNEANI